MRNRFSHPSFLIKTHKDDGNAETYNCWKLENAQNNC